MNISFFRTKSNLGFTLIEVMVAVSIFTIIVTVGIVALLTMNNAHRKSQLDRQGIDSLSYVLESMSRSLRTAQKWTSPASVSDYIEFEDQDGQEVTYYLDPGMGKIMKVDDSGEYPVNPDNVLITDMTFSRFEGPGIQSYTQINLAGFVTNGRQTSDFAVQTSVSKRALDVAQ